jgi:hypothetical protein
MRTRDDGADTLVHYGGAVKALGGNRVGGHVVLYGTPADADLSRMRDYFTKGTDFGLDVTSRGAVLYHHGLKAPLGKRRLGIVELKADDAGIWAEGELALRDEYERKVLAMAEAGKLGWSSGTAAHLVERKAVGGGVHEVLAWPLGPDCSLTPTPCDYRTAATSLKALIDLEAVERKAQGDGRDDATIEAALAVERLSAALKARLYGVLADDSLDEAARRNRLAACFDDHRDALARVAEGMARCGPDEAKACERDALAALFTGLTFDDHAATVQTAVSSLSDRFGDLLDLRNGQGRHLSERRRSGIKSLRDGLDQLLDRSVPKARIEEIHSLEASILATSAKLG